MDPLDLTPVPFDCLRCGRAAPMRFRGLCDDCRAQLRDGVRGESRQIAVEEYTPKMNVTPNAVALKDD